MLGTVASGRGWLWAASGKHPATSDFFQAGLAFPLMKGFSDWVDNGYQALTKKGGGCPGPLAWRFWARSGEKERLAVGLLRDSSDRLGRPYPLLIMGTGPLNGWEDHWDLVPFACEGAWNQMEYLSAQSFKEFQSFESEIQNVRPPQARWLEFGAREKALECTKDYEDRINTMAMEGEIRIPLEEASLKDYSALIYLCHALLRTHLSRIPSAVFMGGNQTRPFMTAFQRPLTTEDFFGLWSVS